MATDVAAEDVSFDFVDNLPPLACAKWREILSRLYSHRGQWARVRFKIPRASLGGVAWA